MGAALAEAFRATGAEVFAPGRGELDVRDGASVDAYVRQMGGVDLLIANAGLAEDAVLARTSEEGWDRSMEVNLHGAARCAKAVMAGMMRARRGHVVLVSSHSALHPPVGQAAYAAAKAGLLGLMKSLAKETGRRGIRVNAVLPGFLETRMTVGLSAERRAAVLEEHVLGRFNTPQEVAAFLVHLHFQLAHTSGQVFQLDSRVC